MTHVGRVVAATLALTMSMVGAGPLWAQTATGKVLRMITVEPGGVSDVVARIVMPDLSAALGQPVVVDNRGGASGLLAIQGVLKAAPDGETILVYTNTLWVSPLLQNVPYDPVRDFLPITLAVSSPNILVVHPSLPAKSVRELIALARSKPGDLNYSSGVTGATAHLAAELFKSMAGVNIVRIPYKGSGPALTSLLSGNVHLTFAVPASGLALMSSGRLRALAVSSAAPSPLAPGLPTIASAGLAGFESVTSTGFFAPAKTPEAAVNRLSQHIARFLSRDDIKEKFLGIGAETIGSSPERLAAVIKADMAKWGKLIKDAGIRAD